jgi:hypothetical protein
VEPTVCAVLAPGLEASLDAQTRAPDARVVAADVLGAGLREGAAAGTTWLWIADGSAIPRPEALAALLDAAARLEAVEPAVLLASRVAGDGAHAPLAPQDATAVAMRTVGLKVLPVRAVTGASLLVRREAATPASGGAFVWTARLLRDGSGFLVPDSVADANGAGHGARSPRVAAQLLAGTALRPRERLRLAAEVAERALMRRSAG